MIRLGVSEGFVIFTFGFLFGSVVKGWICGARELRRSRRGGGMIQAPQPWPRPGAKDGSA